MPYQVSRNGRSLGSFSRSQLAEGLSRGTLLASDHVWREGMPDWVTLGAKGVAGADAHKPSFWDAMPDGPHPGGCPSCGGAQLNSAPNLYRLGGMTVVATGVLVPQQHPNVSPPPKPSTMALGLLLYLVVWPICNAICLAGLGMALGDQWIVFGMLLSFTCLGLIIWWHLQLIRRNELGHAKDSYLWRNSWMCLSCGQRCLSVDPDAADEVHAA